MTTLELLTKRFNVPQPYNTTGFEVPYFTRDDLALLLHEMEFTTGVEVGVESGRYSEILCKANPQMLLFCIDPWSPSAYGNSRYGLPYLEPEFERNYNRTVERMKGYNCQIVRQPSLQAVKQFQPRSLDFVYLDGNHDFQNVANDICEWERIIRPGGILAGHDYTRFASEKEIHVYQVVNAYTRAHAIRPWFILGERSKSWMWVVP